MRLTVTGEGSRSNRTTFKAYCLVSDSVGDAVYIRGDRIDLVYQVTKVNIDALSAIQACTVGLIRTKLTATTCIVQTSGEFNTSGLTPGKLLFVSTQSQISCAPPDHPLTGTRILQTLGTALASDVALLRIGPPVRLIPA